MASAKTTADREIVQDNCRMSDFSSLHVSLKPFCLLANDVLCKPKVSCACSNLPLIHHQLLPFHQSLGNEVVGVVVLPQIKALVHTAIRLEENT